MWNISLDLKYDINPRTLFFKNKTFQKDFATCLFERVSKAHICLMCHSFCCVLKCMSSSKKENLLIFQKKNYFIFLHYLFLLYIFGVLSYFKIRRRNKNIFFCIVQFQHLADFLNLRQISILLYNHSTFDPYVLKCYNKWYSSYMFFNFSKTILGLLASSAHSLK